MKAAGLAQGIAKYALGFGLLAFMLYRSWDDKTGDDGKVIRGVGYMLQQTPDWTLFPICLALQFVIVSLQIFRWYLLVRAVGLPFTPRNAMRLGFCGYFFNIFLPGSIGGDFAKAFVLYKDYPTKRPLALATLVIDRILGLFGLLLITTLVGGGSWLGGDARIAASESLQKIIITTTAVTSTIALGWLLLGWLPERRKNALEDWLHRVKPQRIGQTLAEFWFAARTYRGRSKVIYLSVLISVVSHISMVLAFHLSVRVFPLPEPATLAEHAVIAPIGFIAQVFFPAPGGVGGAELIFGLLYQDALHRPLETGVMGRLTLRVFEWTIGLLGYLVFLNTKKELKV